jgi:hypothetical protein
MSAQHTTKWLADWLREEAQSGGYAWNAKMKESADRLIELKQQRDKLLDAAIRGADWMHWWIEYECCDCDGSHICGKTERTANLTVMREAIAKAQGVV